MEKFENQLKARQTSIVPWPLTIVLPLASEIFCLCVQVIQTAGCLSRTAACTAPSSPFTTACPCWPCPFSAINRATRCGPSTEARPYKYRTSSSRTRRSAAPCTDSLTIRRECDNTTTVACHTRVQCV